MGKSSFYILKVIEESSRIRIQSSEVRIRIRTKMSRIPNTGQNLAALLSGLVQRQQKSMVIVVTDPELF
jgi:hypothetical protein